MIVFYKVVRVESFLADHTRETRLMGMVKLRFLHRVWRCDYLVI
jgi:hypothetical protein